MRCTQAPVGRQLHLHVVNRPCAVDRLDIEKRQFVLLEILRVEGVVEGDFDNRLLRPEDRVEQVDQAARFSGVPKVILKAKSTRGSIPSGMASAIVWDRCLWVECIIPNYSAARRPLGGRRPCQSQAKNIFPPHAVTINLIIADHGPVSPVRVADRAAR